MVREYERLAAAATLLPPLSRMMLSAVAPERVQRSLLISEERYGLSEPVAERYLRVLDFWYKILSACSARFAIAEPSIGLEKLGKFKLVIAPAFEFMSEETQTTLLEYSKKGGNLIFGPRAPELNERMEKALILGNYVDRPKEHKEAVDIFGVHFDEVLFFGDPPGSRISNSELNSRIICERQNEAGKIIFFGALPPPSIDPGFCEALKPFIETLLMRAGVEPSFIPSDSRIDVTVFDESGRTILFLANPTPETITSRVNRTPFGLYLNPENGDKIDSSGSFEISLGPWEIVALEKVEK